MRTKQTSRERQGPSPGIRLNDIGFRLILIPTLGILIPLLTGMLKNLSLSQWWFKFSFLFTIAIAWVIWEGNRYLLFTLRAYFNWYEKPLRKIIAILLTVPFFTVPVTVLLLVIWYRIFNEGVVDWPVVRTTTLLILLAVLYIVHVYETVFLVREAESEMVLRAETEKHRAEAELAALKNQIDPHFMFNSLNTLSHLINEAPNKAVMFNDHLADVYRYILQNRDRDLVMLGEEISFLEDYFALLKIRFADAIHLEMNIPGSAMEQYLVPPISIQVLAENAIKHNEFSDQSPLHIHLALGDEAIMVWNSIRPKTLRKASSGLGLQNLDERYRLTTQKSIAITREEGRFQVRLPLLNIA